MLHRRLTLIAALLFCCVSSLPHRSQANSDSPNGKITIYRDKYGVPHIYAPTHEAGLYAQGWASAEDRLDEILKNYLRGTGEMAAAFGGEDNLRDDTQARMWRYYDVARNNYGKILPEVRAGIEAFVALNEIAIAPRSRCGEAGKHGLRGETRLRRRCRLHRIEVLVQHRQGLQRCDEGDGRRASDAAECDDRPHERQHLLPDRDQAEKLFSKAKMKPTWFAKEELLNGHVKSQIELEWPKKQAVAR